MDICLSSIINMEVGSASTTALHWVFQGVSVPTFPRSDIRTSFSYLFLFPVISFDLITTYASYLLTKFLYLLAIYPHCSSFLLDILEVRVLLYCSVQYLHPSQTMMPGCLRKLIFKIMKILHVLEKCASQILSQSPIPRCHFSLVRLTAFLF